MSLNKLLINKGITFHPLKGAAHAKACFIYCCKVEILGNWS